MKITRADGDTLRVTTGHLWWKRHALLVREPNRVLEPHQGSGIGSYPVDRRYLHVGRGWDLGIDIVWWRFASGESLGYALAARVKRFLKREADAEKERRRATDLRAEEDRIAAQFRSAAYGTPPRATARTRRP